MDTINPSVTSKIDNQGIGEVFFVNFSDIVKFLSAAFDFRGQNVIFNLKNVLQLNKDEISKLLAHELGKPISQCIDEINTSIEILENSGTVELLGENDSKLLVIGSIASPIHELAFTIAENINKYTKFIYKPSSKVARTLDFIYKKMCEEIGIQDRILIAPMTNDLLDETVHKIKFEKIIKFSRSLLHRNDINLEDRSQHDSIVIMESNSDLDYAVNILLDNLMSFEKQNRSKIQHVFIQDTIIEAFKTKLISKINLVLKSGKADDPDVNFADSFKDYKRAELKELLLEMVSLGSDLIYGSIEDIINSPIIVQCDSSMEEYYVKDFWGPVIFLIPFNKIGDIPMLIVPFNKNFNIISLLKENNSEILKNNIHHSKIS